MTSIALARKWRPKSFATLIGQDHVSQALIHSLEQSRLHHAYLFTGTRGVGKTTIARLFAKALNCESGVSATPCLHCDSCLAIDAGAYIDLIEIDAASNTRVEEIREVLDNVPYAPTVGRYKIYLIDEVHMLSQHSFNALLKTLEEPPAHVKFLLATTDPQKLPATILSRCLQFHLRPISVSCIAQQLHWILKEEGITDVEEEAVQLLAKSADGSMRDALSLLDQAIAASQGHLTLSLLASQLNLMETHDAEQIIEALANGNVSDLLTISERIASQGGYYEKVLQDLIVALHRLSLMQVLDSHSPILEEAQSLIQYKNSFVPEELQLMYQIALKGSQDILITPTLAVGFEMTLLRLHTFVPVKPQQSPLPAQQPEILSDEKHVDAPSAASHHIEMTTESTLQEIQTKTHPKEAIIESDEAKIISSEMLSSPFESMEFALFDDMLPIDEFTSLLDPQPVILENQTTSIATPSPEIHPIVASPKESHPLDTDWQTIISHLKLTGLAGVAVDHASLIRFDEHQLILGVSHAHRSLFTPAIIKKIQQAVETHYQTQITLNLEESNHTTPAVQRQQQQDQNRTKAIEILEKDTALQTIKQVFSAEIHKDSVEFLKDGI
jgi:DNA polymerase III subunit gamma/tau